MTTQNDLELIWASSGGSTDPGSTKYATGWVAEKPTFQNFNYVLKNLSTNLLALAEGGIFDFQSNIEYKVGSKVVYGNKIYTCTVASTGQVPSDGSQYWTKTDTFGVDLGSIIKEYGVHIKDVNVRGSSNLWGSNDLTIESPSPLIGLITNNISTKNWLIGNISGEVAVVDIGTTTTPDNRSVALSEATVSRLYHEGHKPTQSEVAGTIPENPQDGVLYARKDNAWSIVTGNTVSSTPPPATIGAGQGWYNLEDGQQYVDIDDGDSTQWVLSNPPIIPDRGAAWTVDTLDPETVDGIGTIRLMQNLSGSTISAGATVAGSSLTNVALDGAGNIVTLGSPTGSWKQVVASGQGLIYGYAGHFVRVA